VSFLDELKGLEDRVRERMGELRPLVAEYRELEQVAERLGIKTGDSVAEMQGARAGAGRKPASPTRRRASRTTRTSQPSAAPGSRSGRAPASSAAGRARTRGNGGRRQQQVLELVNERPGITVREVGQQLRVDPTSLYRVVRKLEQEGRVKKQGRELQPS
jgi:Winged helix-turn-helix DNA-binding